MLAIGGSRRWPPISKSLARLTKALVLADDGGVRGLSYLRLFTECMRLINISVPKNRPVGRRDPRPHDDGLSLDNVEDNVVGTSTRGLIALMPGKLHQKTKREPEGKQRGGYLGQTSKLLSDKAIDLRRLEVENCITACVQCSIIILTLMEYLFPPFKKFRHRARIRARWSQSAGQTQMGITFEVRRHMTIATGK
jgi:hypothetical protein